MIQFSFGPKGEFFMASDTVPEDAAIEIADKLYRKIMTARSEIKIFEAASREINGAGDGRRG